MTCSLHRDRDARGVCSGCGRAFCSACLVDAEGASYCRPCRAARVFPVGKRRTRGEAAPPGLLRRLARGISRLFGGGDNR